MEPPAVDRRILNQLALFSLISSPEARLDDWLASNPRLFRKVRIPAALKWEIRDKLDQANVNERVLFPGLDGLGRWLARYYTPKAGSGPPPTSPGKVPPDPRQTSTRAGPSLGRRSAKRSPRKRGGSRRH
jgi:hypothetical protein